MKKTLFNVTCYLVAFIALQLFVAFGVGFIAQKAFGMAENDSTSLVVASALTNCVVIALFLSLKMAPAGKTYLLSRPWRVLVWSALAALGVVIPSVWLQELLPPLPDIVSEQMMKMMRVHGAYFAIAISAALFALVHGNPAQMPHAFAVGLLLGWMYCSTKSIIPGVVFHWCNNTVAYLISVAYPAPDIKLIDIFGGNQTSLVLSIVFSLCIFVPSVIQLKREFSRRRA